MLQGKRVGIDATTLEGNAAIRLIVHRNTGESHGQFLIGLAKAYGIATPTRKDLAQLDRKRKKSTSTKDWKSATDEDARIAKMKDGRTLWPTMRNMPSTWRRARWWPLPCKPPTRAIQRPSKRHFPRSREVVPVV